MSAPQSAKEKKVRIPNSTSFLEPELTMEQGLLCSVHWCPTSSERADTQQYPRQTPYPMVISLGMVDGEIQKQDTGP
jgi:hypothetical protein